MTSVSTSELRDAERSFALVQPELEMLRLDELAAMNVDVVSATSIVLGVADRILAFRDRVAALPDFELRHVDRLVDYALAAWYVYVTHLPAPDPHDVTEVLAEVDALRAKLLMWSVPLVGSGIFEQAAIDKIREGSSHKDGPSDLIALVGLYRSRWDEVRGICAVTEADLARASEIGPLAFAAISRRENRSSASSLDASLRVRRAWTLLDRAYAQCRRALAYLRFAEGDADSIAPSLRRNPGKPPAAAEPGSRVSGADGGLPVTAAAPPGGAPIGGAQEPFAPGRSN